MNKHAISPNIEVLHPRVAKQLYVLEQSWTNINENLRVVDGAKLAPKTLPKIPEAMYWTTSQNFQEFR